MPSHSHVSDYEPVVRPRGATSPAEDHTAKEWSKRPVAPDFVAKVQRDGAEKSAAPAPALALAKGEGWLNRHGHTISYVGLFLFTTVLLFRPYELSPALSFLSTSAFWLALFTLAVFFPTQFALEGTLTARPREVNLVLLLCLTALLSMPLAIDRTLAWDTFFNKEFIRAVLMFIVLVNVVRTERRLKGLFFLALGVSCYLSINAVRDYLSGRVAASDERIWGALGGMFGNPNDLALYLVTIIPIAFALFLSARALPKILYGVCGVLVAGAVVVTFSRGGFLGLIVALIVLAWKLGRGNRVSMVVLTVITLGLFIALAPGNYGLRLASIVFPSLDPVGSSSARSALLKLSIKTALAHPLFGVGMGNFNIVSRNNQVTHNAYTQVAAEMGMAAMVIYIMFIVAPIRRLRQIERETFTSRLKERRFYYLSVGLQASLIGYMVSSFFGSVAYQFYIYYLVGYAICFRRIYRRHTEASAETTPPMINQSVVQ